MEKETVVMLCSEFRRESNRAAAYKHYHESKHDPEFQLQRARYRADHAADAQKRTRRWRELNKEKKREHSRQWSRKKRFKGYGITEQQYDHILDGQAHRCKACGCTFDEHNGPVVDHCHSTGSVRGILCRQCNLSLGVMQEQPERLEKLAEYARRFCAGKRE